MSLLYVTLKNRSNKTLTGHFDGKQHTFPVGYEGQWPETQALKFRDQNPVMGSEDYFTGQKQYLMAIVEHGDDTDIIEQNVNAKELWDRSTVVLPPGTELAIIKGRGYHPIADKTRPQPPQLANMESFEPTPGFDTETISIPDAIDYKP